MSQILEPRAQAIDALSQDWQGEVYVHVSTIFQSHSESKDHPGQRGISNTPPPVAVTTVVCTSTMTVCGAPSYHNHSVPPGPTVTTGVCLGQQVVPSAHMEALMQHYQAEGFQKRSLDPQQNVQRQVDSLCSLSRRTKN